MRVHTRYNFMHTKCYKTLIQKSIFQKSEFFVLKTDWALFSYIQRENSMPIIIITQQNSCLIFQCHPSSINNMKIQLFESSIENYTCCVKQFCGCNFELYKQHRSRYINYLPTTPMQLIFTCQIHKLISNRCIYMHGVQ